MKRFSTKANVRNQWASKTAAQPRRRAGTNKGLPLFERLEARQLLSAAVLGTGTGLEGQYYAAENLTNLQVTRVDPTVNFTWTGTTPAAGVGQYEFSTRWTGQVAAEYSQTYTFYTESDDGVRLWVNGQELVNNWTVHGATQNAGTIALVAGQKYSIEMDYYQNMGASVAQLSWSSASQSQQIIPTSQLYPTLTAPSGLTAVTGGSTQINLNWSEATSGASGFDVLRSTAGGAYTQVTQVAGTTTSYSDTGLATGTAYSYEVLACNVAGNSAVSNVASFTTPAVTTAPPITGNWTSIYNDTFSGSALDSSWSNSMWGTTYAGSATVANNLLKLTAPNASTQELINTENASKPFSFTYGYAQVTMQVPKGQGIWPAFWMMPLESYSPNGSAGDLVAYSGQGNVPNTDNASYSWGSPSTSVGTSYVDGVNLSQGFHTYGVDWEKNQITWYLDGKAIESVSSSQAAICSDPMYLILDVWLGGANGAPNSTTPFPATMNISSMQVWQNTTGTAPAPTVPAAPTGLTATLSGTSQINLAWSEATSGCTAFDILRSVAGGAYTQLAQVSGTTLAYSDTGLAASTAYSYEVTAVNAVGNSTVSNVASATTPAPAPTMPATPTMLTATLSGTSQANLGWSEASSGCTNFDVMCSVAGGSYTQLTQVSGGSTSYSATGLAAGTTYSYEVMAVNAMGTSPASNAMAVTTPVALPAAPTGLTATLSGTSQINLAWSEATSGVSGFYVMRSVSGGSYTQLAQVSGTTTSYSDTGLAAGTSFSYEVLAYNATGNSAVSNVAAATTPSAPTVPTGLTATLSGTSQINLAWSEATSGCTGFDVMCSVSGGSYTQVAQVSGSTTTYSATGLAAGTTYSYEVKAVNAVGASAVSNVASATTPSSTPPAGGPPIAGNWTSIYNDTFGGTSLDSTWGTDLWNVNYAGPATVSNNTLHLTAPNASTEATIDTENCAKPFSFTYGYAQVTMQIPKGQGIWPAFWLMPLDSLHADNSTEIDAYEGQGNVPNIDTATYHWGSGQQNGTDYNAGVDLSQGYHAYGVDWEPNQIVWYLDGKAIKTITSAQATISPYAMYLILDVWLGGWNGAVNSTTPFPATLNITDVQVWQQSASSSAIAAAVTPANTTTAASTTLNSQTVAAGVLSGS